MGRAFVLILNTNGKKDTLECLKSLRKTKIPIEIVVIDNASTDGSVVVIKKKFPKIKIIENKKNLGFAGGNNVGIRYALKNGAEDVILLNNDTIVASGSIESLVKNRSDITGAVLKFYRGRELVYDLGGYINWWIGRATHEEVKSKKDIGPRTPNYVSGATMRIRRKVFEKIGLLDERFFIYYEDADFCTKAKKAGFKIALEPKAIIFHKLSAFKGRRSFFNLYYSLRSNLLFINKNLVWWRRPIGWTYWSLLAAKVIFNWLLAK